MIKRILKFRLAISSYRTRTHPFITFLEQTINVKQMFEVCYFIVQTTETVKRL